MANTLWDAMRSRISTQSTLKSWVRYYETEKAPRDFYNLLKMYYLNNGLYDELYDALYSVSSHEESLRALRNPAYRAVEFYPAKLWPGRVDEAFKIEAKNKRVIEPIQRMWGWSNWAVQKQRVARWLALYGDWFVKVPTNGERVWLQTLHPGTVTDFDVSERGFLNYIRIDVPQKVRDGDTVKSKMYTEIWDKASQMMRTWLHDKGEMTEAAQLGKPTKQAHFSDFGIDFIPIVYAPMRDVGEERGQGAFTQCIDKIDEANRMCTRLHQMLYRHNNVIWALRANAVDPTGRPMPAPTLDTDSDGEVSLAGEKLLRLPGNSELQSLVPNLSYGDALKILDAHMVELEHDLPELAYWRLRELGELSGKAVQLLLGDAIDKMIEVRGNAESGLIRANQMALTIGAAMKIDGFSDLGDYENGDLEHTFVAREIIPTPEHERASAVQQWVGAKVPLVSALQRVGWTSEEIAAMQREQKKEQEQGLRNKQALLATTMSQVGGNGREDQGDAAGASQGQPQRNAGDAGRPQEDTGGGLARS